MKKVRITAMKQTCYDDLIEKYENPSEHSCDIKVGQSFIADGWKKPDGLCDSAWDSMSAFVMALSYGAEDIYDGWMKNKHSAMISCNDGFRPVSFLLEVINEENEKPEKSEIKYSEKLNGYWEEGYHYYLEFRDDKLTVRNYRREIALETTVSYNAAKLESGERTVITLEDNILSRTYDGQMMTEIKELAYENGELKLLYYYTIMGETLYTLKKTENGPFDHIIIRDDEYMDFLQGKWEEWRASGNEGNPLTINGNKISWLGNETPFHVVSYKYDKDSVYIVPENLIDDSFPGYTKVQVYPDKLTARMMICDMTVPLTVFARKDMLGKIEIPDAAKEKPRNTMMFEPPKPQIDMMTMHTKEPEIKPVQKKKAFCPNCGYKLPEKEARFCPECGTKIE